MIAGSPYFAPSSLDLGEETWHRGRAAWYAQSWKAGLKQGLLASSGLASQLLKGRPVRRVDVRLTQHMVGARIGLLRLQQGDRRLASTSQLVEVSLAKFEITTDFCAIFRHASAEAESLTENFPSADPWFNNLPNFANSSVRCKHRVSTNVVREMSYE